MDGSQAAYGTRLVPAELRRMMLAHAEALAAMSDTPRRPPEIPEERPPETPPTGPDPGLDHPPVELPPRPPGQDEGPRKLRRTEEMPPLFKTDREW